MWYGSSAVNMVDVFYGEVTRYENPTLEKTSVCAKKNIFCGDSTKLYEFLSYKLLQRHILVSCIRLNT